MALLLVRDTPWRWQVHVAETCRMKLLNSLFQWYFPYVSLWITMQQTLKYYYLLWWSKPNHSLWSEAGSRDLPTTKQKLWTTALPLLCFRMNVYNDTCFPLVVTVMGYSSFVPNCIIANVKQYHRIPCYRIDLNGTHSILSRGNLHQ
jgi:hypothetical protein